MAGVGGSWGSAEELLHPRDSHGRFRSKWKMSMAAVKRTMARLDAFSPRTFQSDQEAGVHVQGLAGKKKNLALDNYLRNSARINADLRKGQGSDTRQVKAVEAAMQPLQDDLILNRIVGPEAFGLKPENLANLEEYTGKLVADKGFGSANVGTPLASSGPSITMVIAAPKGTRVAVPRSQGSREVILDREQPLRITKVQPDGKGGFYVMAVAMEKGSTGNLRTKKLGTRAPRPTEPTPDVAVSPNAPAVAPQAPAAPVQTGKPGRPAGPPPPPRTEPHVAESIGGGPAPEAKAPEPAPTAETPTPEPKKATPAPEPTPTPETPPAAPEPAPSMSREEADRLIRRTERAQAQANRAKLANARMEGAEEERKKAQAAARRAVRLKNEEHAKRNEEDRKRAIMGYLAQVGETTLPDPMTQAFIGIKMSAVENKKMSRRRAGLDFREAAANQANVRNKNLLNKFADLLVYRPKTTKAAPSAPQKAPPVAAAPKPERLTPSMAVGKTNTSRVQTGDRVLVKQNAKGEWVPSTTKTGATTITVSKKQPISYKGRSSNRITGTDEEGNEITVVDGPGIQTYWLADQTAAGKKAAAPKMSNKPLIPNRWGSRGGEIEFHEDGIIGRGIHALGPEGRLDVGGEPLANVLGKIATRISRGDEKAKTLVPQLNTVAKKLPEGSKARNVVERMAKDLTPRVHNEPEIPESSPAPIKKLRAALIDNPLISKEPGRGDRETETLAELMKRWDRGNITPSVLIDQIRRLRDRRHESAEGYGELSRSIKETLDELEALRAKDRESLKPPQFRNIASRPASYQTGSDALDSATEASRLLREASSLPRGRRISAHDVPKIEKAVMSYTDKGYFDINGFLHGEHSGSPEIQAHIDNLDKMIKASSLANDTVLYRGTRFEGEPPDEIVNPGFSSTTALDSIARDFAKGKFMGLKTGSTDRPGTPYVLEILAPKGTPGVQLTGLSQAAEILMQRGLRLKKVGLGHKTDGVQTVVYKVVPIE